jgi:hypothetical protein
MMDKTLQLKRFWNSGKNTPDKQVSLLIVEIDWLPGG